MDAVSDIECNGYKKYGYIITWTSVTSWYLLVAVNRLKLFVIEKLKKILEKG